MIREISQSEFEPFVELMGEVECGTEFDPANPEHDAWIREAISHRYGAGARFYALYEDDAPAAVAGFVIEKILTTKWSRCELLDIGVIKKHRRKGYGTVLLAFVEDQARAAGCWSLHLKTYSADYEAVAFYMRNGYAVVGNVESTNGPDDFGDVWLAKVLAENE